MLFRSAGAIGVVVVGGLLAGGVGLAMPPPKVNIPKLAVTRVQTSATIARNSSQTVTANCPPGQVVLGGGWSSDWDSTRIDDPQPMVRWMEADPVYVINRAQVRLGGALPSVWYWYIARADESAHLSDQAWESNRFPWYYQHLVEIGRAHV